MRSGNALACLQPLSFIRGVEVLVGDRRAASREGVLNPIGHHELLQLAQSGQAEAMVLRREL